MALGIMLKGSNAIHFSSPIDFLFEFIPQITMLMVLFGFMDLMIVLKWLTNYDGKEAYAPSVISMMIDMFLNGGEPTNATDLPLLDTTDRQIELMNLLLYITLACIPLMLCVKPIWIGLTSKKHSPAVSEEFENSSETSNLQYKTSVTINA
jgi:V-type H+-transporting ATPase subunit a